VDYLDNLLEAVRIGGGICSACSLCSPGALGVPGTADASFHFVISGRCWVSATRSVAPLELRAGDLVVVRSRAEAMLASAPARGSRRLRPVCVKPGEGPCRFGDPADTETLALLCGYFRFPGESSFAALLPEFIHVPADESSDRDETKATVELMLNEAHSAHVAHRAVLNRLAEVLFIRVYRANAARLGPSTVGPTALRDKQIGNALAHMHADLQRDWTIDELARIAACSRSAFCARFASAVGVPPLRYLTSIRLAHAKELLITQPISISRVSDEAGYGSVQAFTRAFKRAFGTAPAEFRMRQFDANSTDTSAES
jgi:AraC-like DNA-binding protein